MELDLLLIAGVRLMILRRIVKDGRNFVVEVYQKRIEDIVLQRDVFATKREAQQFVKDNPKWKNEVIYDLYG